MEMEEPDRMLYLIKHGGGNDKFKDTALIRACLSGELKVVKELVKQHNVKPKGNRLGDYITLQCMGIDNAAW